MDGLKRASIVYNPTARNAPPQARLSAAARLLQPDGWEIDLRVSEGPGHAVKLAREAVASGASVVFGCGGDGTLNEVLNGLAGSEAALGVVRGGMGNVFAKEIGVPRAPEQALAVLREGETRRFDLGRADGRYFLMMAGIGFDAEVVRTTPARRKRLLGSTSLVLQGLRELPRFRSDAARLGIEGVEREAELYWLLLGNTRSYGGVFDITSKALANDGLLDAYVYAGRGLPWVLTTAVRILLRRAAGARGVTFERLASLAVTTPGLPVQVDGEYIGETPMRFSVEREALPVLLPRDGGRRLLANGEPAG